MAGPCSHPLLSHKHTHRAGLIVNSQGVPSWGDPALTPLCLRSFPAPTPYCTPTSGSLTSCHLHASLCLCPCCSLSAQNALPPTFLSMWQTSYPPCHLFSVAFVTLYSPSPPQVGSLPLQIQLVRCPPEQGPKPPHMPQGCQVGDTGWGIREEFPGSRDT